MSVEPDPHKAVLHSAGIYDQFCAVFRDVTRELIARRSTILLQLRPLPNFASRQVETTLMPAADQAKICGDRALRVWELQLLDLTGTSAFIERQMKMGAGIVERAIADGSANDDDIVVFKIQNPAFVGLKLVFGKSANPPPATVTDGFAKPLGIQLGINLRLQPQYFKQTCALAGSAKAHPDEVAGFHLVGNLIAEILRYQQSRPGIFVGGLD